MLNIIMDYTNMDRSFTGMDQALKRDRQRIAHIKHNNRPADTDSLIITAYNGIFTDSIIYYLQYGKKLDVGILPIGPEKRYCHEALPLLNHSL